MKMREGGWSREITVRELPGCDHHHGESTCGLRPAVYANCTGTRKRNGRSCWPVRHKSLRLTMMATILWQMLRAVTSGIFHPEFRIRSKGYRRTAVNSFSHFRTALFLEDSTFSITDMFAHMPKEALAKNFGVDVSAFDQIPKEERFIFEVPLPPALQADTVGSAQGHVPLDMKFRLTAETPTRTAGGAVRIADMRNFVILERDRGGVGGCRTRSYPRDSLASECRRMAIPHCRQGAHDRLWCPDEFADL